MIKLRNRFTGEVSYFDEREIADAKTQDTKLVNKYKRMHDTEKVSDLIEVSK